MTVDHVSSGRLDHGLGAGAPGCIDISYAMTGLPDWPPKERVDRFREDVEIVDQLLRNPETTYAGKYYQINGTVMNPLPFQKPRPALIISGNGLRLLKVAAHLSDTRNMFGGVDVKSFDEMLVLTRNRSARLDEYCSEIGRDPTTLRRSMLIDTNEKYQRIYSIPGACEEIVKRYLETGISEIIFFYPFSPILMPLFEQIIHEAIPRMRSNNYLSN